MEDYERIISVTQRLIDRYRSRDPFAICDEAGITIKLMTLSLRQKAYSVRILRKPFIVINQEIKCQFQPILCAHELGHIVLHPNEVEMMKSASDMFKAKLTAKTERETHIFAAELFIDDDELVDFLSTCDADIYSAAKAFFVPAEIMNVKLEIMEYKGYGVKAPLNVPVRFLRDDFDDWFFDDDSTC